MKKNNIRQGTHTVGSEKDKDFIRFVIYIIFSMLAVYGVLWAFTGIWPFSSNPYNSYTLQAQSWLSGRLDLGKNYSHLEIAEYGGKFFISFPPFPSYIMIPFALIFGSKTPDHFITAVTSIIGAIYLFKMLRQSGLSNEKSALLSLLATIGSNFLTLGTNGYVWFIAQVFSFTLLSASFYYALKPGKYTGTISLLLWACAVGSRPISAIFIPLILYILYKKEPSFKAFIKKIFIMALPAFLIAVSYMCLNYARFGNILEFGHNYLPEFKNAEHGQFSLSYLAQNFASIFRPAPIGEGGVIAFPKFNGFAFYIASPIFLFYGILFIRAIIKKVKLDKIIFYSVPVLILLHFIITCFHKTLGGWHFGNRYTVDVIPAIMLGLCGITPDEEKYVKIANILLIFGVCLNAIGYVLLIKKAL